MYRGIKPQEGTGAPRAPLTCHCEERSDVAISQYPAASWESYRRNRSCLPEIAPQGHFLALRAQGATAPLGPRNDKSGGVCHFDGGLYGLQVHRREGHAPPLQWRVQSPRVPGNLQLPMAVTPRKGDAASVRRQSRQRLRSERRYRRNRFLRFYRHLVRTGSAFPRLPRRFAPRNDNSEVHTILTMACTDRQHCAGPGCPLPYNGVYGRREYPEICSCQWRSLPVKGTPHP